MKILKIFSIVGGVLVILATLLFVINFAVVKFDVNKLFKGVDREERSFENTLESKQDLVMIEAQNCEINFSVSADDQVHIHYFESKWKKFEIKNTETMLTITEIVTKKWYEYLLITFDGYDDKITIELPESYRKNIVIETSNGGINIQGLQFVENITAKTSNGSVTLDQIKANEIFVHSSNGAITVRDVVGVKLNGTTINGQMLIQECEISSIQGSSTSNGKIVIEKVQAADLLDVHTSNGLISLTRLLSNDIRLKTSNGWIKGSIVGEKSDYVITSSTSNGQNNLGNNLTGTKKLNVQTSNGGIDITFVK